MFPSFAGRFNDFTVQWYQNVGATISLAMFVNIFTPHISGIIAILMNGFKKLLDRGCHKDLRRTK